TLKTVKEGQAWSIESPWLAGNVILGRRFEKKASSAESVGGCRRVPRFGAMGQERGGPPGRRFRKTNSGTDFSPPRSQNEGESDTGRRRTCLLEHPATAIGDDRAVIAGDRGAAHTARRVPTTEVSRALQSCPCRGLTSRNREENQACLRP